MGFRSPLSSSASHLVVCPIWRDPFSLLLAPGNRVGPGGDGHGLLVGSCPQPICAAATLLPGRAVLG